MHADLRWFMKGNKLILALAGVACIAAHADDVATGRFNGENFQNGWVNICDNPYPETIDAVRWIGDNMYSMRFGKESKEVVP